MGGSDKSGRSSEENASDHLDELPTLRLPEPSSVRRSMRFEFRDADIVDAGELEELLGRMFVLPQAKFFTFRPRDENTRGLIGGAETRGLIVTAETQRHWYVDPVYPKNFVRAASAEWDWQVELIRDGPELFRSEIQLTPSERLRREQAQLIAAMRNTGEGPQRTSLYQRLNVHYNRHQMAYYLLGSVLAVGGLLTAL
ncbi:MAG: hypothetical protein JHD35_12460 [Sphingopyxis sp.]|nr:hypothetical protein [Sphingopyxis sp.]